MKFKLFWYIYIFISGVMILLSSSNLFATHNKAGEITYSHISGNTYKVSIFTYTNTKQTPQSQPPDRDKLEIFWGDGESDTIPRVNGPNGFGDTIAPFTKKNIYEGIHTYQGAGTYVLYFIDQNRNDDVDNMANSVQQAFFVQSKLVINNGTTGNNSPILLQPPIDHGTFGQIFIHNPNAYDPDGDSLSYEITDCRGLGGSICQGYYLPEGAPDFPNSSIIVNAVTGDFIWDSPEYNSQRLSGEFLFNYAIIIREWRKLSNGNVINIGYVTRDFQVEIASSTNNPPQIFAHDTCVEAGSTLIFNVTAIEPDNELVTISATGEPYELSISPAIEDVTNVSGFGSASYQFFWNTDCSHIRRNSYQVIFKAIDDNPTVNLVDLQTIKITVVGPAPKNPMADPLGDSIAVSWNKSICPNAKGYNIYRRENKANYIPGYCETGVPVSTGYQLIGNNVDINDTIFNDNNNGLGLSPAIEYCYIITAFFTDGIEGYASVETCTILQRDLPVITNVDVKSTDLANGTIYIAWSPPVDLDTNQFPGPYQYILQRADVGSNVFSDVATFTNAADTTYNENGLNTFSNQYKYRVRFYYNSNIFLGLSQEATSIFLTVMPGDFKAKLSWNLVVPWTNDLYYIYRKGLTTSFSLIDSTMAINYTDYTTINDSTYCYYVISKGFYADSSLVYPILNSSQEACTIPYDNEAPCKASLSANSNCDSSSVEFSWSFISQDSCKTTDIDYFTIYFATEENETFDSVGFFLTNLTSYSFVRTTQIGGCYYITSTDTNGNVSDSSNTICIESCPLYELPNIFTPDGNGMNDLFTPIEQLGSGLNFRDIKDVSIKIFNRWGALVFETTDPEIKWNGKRNNDGEDVPDGTYYYICIINVLGQPANATPLKLHGPISLFRIGDGKKNN